jgi:hypothetical protein
VANNRSGRIILAQSFYDSNNGSRRIWTHGAERNVTQGLPEKNDEEVENCRTYGTDFEVDKVKRTSMLVPT